MRNFLGAVAAVMLWGRGGEGRGPVGTQEAGGVSGRFTREDVEARFSSKQVEQGVYRIEVRQNGMTLTSLVDAVNGVSSLDGFAEESGQGTQMLEGDRALLSGLYTQYTLDATNHDGCVRNGHLLASAYCDDQFVSASDDELYAPNCY